MGFLKVNYTPDKRQVGAVGVRKPSSFTTKNAFDGNNFHIFQINFQI